MKDSNKVLVCVSIRSAKTAGIGWIAIWEKERGVRGLPGLGAGTLGSESEL